jgi:dienelactone hydrolase
VGRWVEEFPGNFAWSNAALVTKGMAPYGAVALAEIDEVCERLRARQGEPDAWRDEWCAAGSRLERLADERSGRTRAAFLLRAGMYYFTGERFIYPGNEKRRIGRKALECQQAGLLGLYPNIERVEVPYEGTTLPGLFLKSGAGKVPTVVVFDGMDNCKEMSVLFAGLEFAARGWNTLAIDGPGQGESLRLRELYARHDYEVPGRAAYEYVAARPEVDPRRVAIMGYSFGGYYAARIAAFEKRYAACIALSALHWDLAAWQTHIKERNASAPKSVAQSNFQFQWVVGAATVDEAIEIARKFSLKHVAKNISCPFLVTHAGNDRVVPVENAQKLYDAVGSKNKTIKIFSTEEGGAEHAHVDNRQVGIDFAADWLEDNLKT